MSTTRVECPNCHGYVNMRDNSCECTRRAARGGGDRPNIIQNYEHDLNSLLDLYQAHDQIHPDKSECGGVGRCLMMRSEVGAEQELGDMLRQIAQSSRLRIAEVVR